MSKLLNSTRGTVTKDKPLAELTWLRVGGPAELLFQPADAQDLAETLKALPTNVPVFPLGVGSNLIVRDGGLKGVTIRLGRGFNAIEILDQNTLRAGAAALDAHVARKAAEAGIDLAFLRTIPGAMGGAVRMNAGCYGSYIADVFVEATAILRDGTHMNLSANDLDFAYRSSSLPDGAIITDVTLKGPNDSPEAIAQKMANALEARAKSQPVDQRSAGSTFRNPAGFSSTGKADDTHDLKAWSLIDAAGLRGYRHGGAQMSEKHPNFLLNADHATSKDLEELGELVRKRVYENSGIQLEWEILRIGENT